MRECDLGIRGISDEQENFLYWEGLSMGARMRHRRGKAKAGGTPKVSNEDPLDTPTDATPDDFKARMEQQFSRYRELAKGSNLLTPEWRKFATRHADEIFR